MKKVTLLALIALSFHSSLSAQITKGSWLVGGTVGFTSTGSSYRGFDDGTTTTFTMAPKAGYFFIDRLAAGLTLPFTYSHQHYPVQSGAANYDQSTLSIGPFVRYYFLPAAKPTNIFVEVYDQYTKYRYSNTNYETLPANTFGFSAGPSFFLNPSVAIECGIGYYWQSSPAKYNTASYHTFTTNIGFLVYLPAKRHKA